MSNKQDQDGYLSLCYHYIRPEKKYDRFPRILGNSIDEFRSHIEIVKNNYSIISPDEARNFSCSDFSFGNGRRNILFTFDDGLSDHYKAAEILSEYGIKAFFFVPTCIFADHLPAGSIIIHYILAKYGITKFLETYREALEEFSLDFNTYNLRYDRGIDDVWDAIAKIKEMINHCLEYADSRKVTTYLYKNLLLRDFPDALAIMHLTKEQIVEMVKMGHSIGAHSKTHISLASRGLTSQIVIDELHQPKKDLESLFNIDLCAIGYPFGEKRDCVSVAQFLSKTKEYELGFTVEPKINFKSTASLDLGRYKITSKDNAEIFSDTLRRLID